MSHCKKLIILAGFLLLLPGIAAAQSLRPQVQVQGQNATGLQPTRRPEMIYVADFRLDREAIQSDEGPLGGGLVRRAPVVRQRNPELTPGEVSSMLAASLVQSLQGHSLPAMRLLAGQSPPRRGWLIQGRLVEVDEGKRVRRAVVGFGAGATHLEVQVNVTNLAPRGGAPFLIFGTETGSGQKPGAAVTVNPYVAAAKFVLEKNATSKDIYRTSSEIAGEIVKYMQSKALY